MTDQLVTVAVSLPESASRVLVEVKPGTASDPHAAAIAAVWAFSQFAPKHWQTAIVSSAPITDVPTPETP